MVVRELFFSSVDTYSLRTSLWHRVQWSVWSRNTVCWHQIQSSPAVYTSYTKAQLLLQMQCQQKVNHPVFQVRMLDCSIISKIFLVDETQWVSATGSTQNSGRMRSRDGRTRTRSTFLDGFLDSWSTSTNNDGRRRFSGKPTVVFPEQMFRAPSICSPSYLPNPNTYNVGRPLSRDVLFCFLSEDPVTNWAEH